MTFTPLQLGTAPDVLATITKKRVLLAFSGTAICRLGWSDEEPNVAVALGDGEDAGWLRVILDEDGITPETVEGRLVLTLPRSTLPDLTECRASPLTWRPAPEAGIDVRLPTVAPIGLRRPKLAVDNAKGKRGGSEPEDGSLTIDVISVPDLYSGLHSTAWANGVELMFLSDGSVSVNGRVSSIDDVEGLVSAAVEKRNAARQRAG